MSIKNSQFTPRYRKSVYLNIGRADDAFGFDIYFNATRDWSFSHITPHDILANSKYWKILSLVDYSISRSFQRFTLLSHYRSEYWNWNFIHFHSIPFTLKYSNEEGKSIFFSHFHLQPSQVSRQLDNPKQGSRVLGVVNTSRD